MNRKVIYLFILLVQEIVLHWADRPDTPSISLDNHSMLTREIPKFSFDIPAVAVPVNIDC